MKDVSATILILFLVGVTEWRVRGARELWKNIPKPVGLLEYSGKGPLSMMECIVNVQRSSKARCIRYRPFHKMGTMMGGSILGSLWHNPNDPVKDKETYASVVNPLLGVVGYHMLQKDKCQTLHGLGNISSRFSYVMDFVRSENCFVAPCGSVCPSASPIVTIIRDPRDTWVSGYLYHIWCPEPWTEGKYCEFLQNSTVEEGLLHEFNGRFRDTMKELHSFLSCYSNRSDVLMIRYEDLFYHPEEMYDRLFCRIASMLHMDGVGAEASVTGRYLWAKFATKEAMKKLELGKAVRNLRKSPKVEEFTRKDVAGGRDIMPRLGKRHYRKGEPGDHENWLSETDLRLFELAGYSVYLPLFGFNRSTMLVEIGETPWRSIVHNAPIFSAAGLLKNGDNSVRG